MLFKNGVHQTKPILPMASVRALILNLFPTLTPLGYWTCVATRSAFFHGFQADLLGSRRPSEKEIFEHDIHLLNSVVLGCHISWYLPLNQGDVCVMQIFVPPDVGDWLKKHQPLPSMNYVFLRWTPSLIIVKLKGHC